MTRLCVVMVAVGSLLLSSAAAGRAAQQTAYVVTHWSGRSPNGGLTFNDGSCVHDIDMELAQQGEALAGWITAATVVQGDCQSILSMDRTPARQTTAVSFTGTLSGSSLSLAMFQARLRNGVPNRVTIILLTGTMDERELIATGALIGPRTWIDIDRDGIPDCDPAILGANGECSSVLASERGVTVRVTRRE